MPMLRTPTATALAVRYLLRGCANFFGRVVGPALQPAPSLGRLESPHHKAYAAPGDAGRPPGKSVTPCCASRIISRRCVSP